MKKIQIKRFQGTGLAILLLCAIIIMGSGTGYGADKVQVLIGTASMGGSYYPVGVGMAEIINKYLPGYSAIAQVTGGSVANLRLLNSKQMTIAFSTFDFGVNALKGEKPYDKPLDVLPIMNLGYFPQQFITLKKTNIKTVYDCKGKKIAIGPPGASSNVNARSILKIHGIGENDFKPFYMGYTEAADALGDGVVDVIYDPAVMPSPATESLFAVRNDVVLVTGDRAVLEKADIPGMVVYKVPKGIYKGFDDDVYTLSTWALIFANGSQDNKLIADVVKVIMDHKDYLKTVHPLGAQVDFLKKSDVDKHHLKIHPGAIEASKAAGAWNK